MNKTKKSANILAGLDESLVVLKTEKVAVRGANTRPGSLRNRGVVYRITGVYWCYQKPPVYSGVFYASMQIRSSIASSFSSSYFKFSPISFHQRVQIPFIIGIDSKKASAHLSKCHS